MRLGLNIGYWGSALGTDMTLIEEAEALEFDSVWAAEAYGSDVATVLAWIGARTERIKLGSAIFQMPARTPAMTAMTAATLDMLSGGRMLLGLGLSGPQVVEGWHGRPYGKPLTKTREYVSIVRKILARDEPVIHHGDHYRIPYDGPEATGLGKPLKLITHPLRSDIPVYLASVGPQNVRLTAEIADGWLPAFYSPGKAKAVWGPMLEQGFARSSDPDRSFDIAPSLSAAVTDDLESARAAIKPELALYIGGMGARGRNFYNDLACRYGYESAAERVQDLYLAGDKAGAIAAVPDALVDEISLIGTEEMIRDRLDVFRDAGVTTLLVSTFDLGTLRTLAELTG